MVFEEELEESNNDQEVFEHFEKGYSRLKVDILTSLDKAPKVYGIAGGSGSGKSHLAERLASLDPRILRITLDDFFTKPRLVGNEKDYDQLESYQLEKANLFLYEITRNKEAVKPIYRKEDGSHSKKKVTLQEGGIIIFEGIYALHHNVIAEIDLGVFLEANTELRFVRRAERDKGFQTVKAVEAKWKFAEEAFIKGISETRKAADILIKNNVGLKPV